jgi:glycine/D-amino acid oxidase-like deaminating enzyme
MQIDYLIIGQGISGTWLSYYLQKNKKSFLVIDNNASGTPSRIAAGIINPVTGRRHVTVWMAEEILPFAFDAYTELGNELGITAISKRNIIDFFPSPQMRQSFQQRTDEGGFYVEMGSNANKYTDYFNYDFGFGTIQPVYTAHLETILPVWRQQLKNNGHLIEEDFDITLLETKKEGIKYKDIEAKKIIFCDGTSSNDNPFFKQLPFAPNKGEVLIAEIPGLPADHIYKKGMMMVPLATADHWWIGSNYAWEYEDEQPTTSFRDKTTLLLNDWLKIPFTIKEHLCGIRPATLERRPFVGIHPQHPGIGILNGLGTKGCSLAPYFAQQLVNNLLKNKPVMAEADINRFSKVLSRS